MNDIAWLGAVINVRLRALRDTGEQASVTVGDAYYQLASYGPGLLLIETVANEFLPSERQLDAAGEARLAELGLRRPEADWPNWALRLEDPTDADLAAAARTVSTALVEVYGVASGRRWVRLRDLRNHKGNRFRLDARLMDDGSVEFAAQDFGPVTARGSADRQFEYWRTVDAEFVPQLVWMLGGEPGEHVIELLARHWSGRRSFELGAVLREAPFPVGLYVN